MKRCGLKLTHDGGVAVLDGRDLVACIEMEKLTNNERYRRIEHTDEIALALHRSGFQPSDIDEYIIDGWDGEVDAWVELLGAAGRVQLKVAPYVEKEPDRANEFTQGFGLNILGRDYTYKSAPHVMGHIASVYCTSPFAIFKQKALCLVWDGSIWPRLYEISDGGIRFINTLFPMIGHAYACAGHHFGPYKNADRTSWKLDLAGKLMSYMSTGTVDSRITAAIQTSYQNNLAGHSPNALSYRRMSANTSVALIQTHRFFEEIGVLVAGAPEHDILATFHYFVERLLIETLRHELARAGRNMSRNLCISGGCGLNIKWNSALRSSGLFRDVWVSPFPNDSGSAIGAACSALVANDGQIGRAHV